MPTKSIERYVARMLMFIVFFDFHPFNREIYTVYFSITNKEELDFLWTSQIIIQIFTVTLYRLTWILTVHI